MQRKSEEEDRKRPKLEEEDRKRPHLEEEERAPAPNFALSGSLAADRRTGNLQKASSSDVVVVSKYSPPADALPPAGNWRIFVFPAPTAKDQTEHTLHLHRKSHFVFGTQTDLADFDLEEEESISGEHAVFQFRKEEGKLYVIDMETSGGTRLNGEVIVPARYVELLDGDLINFGKSETDFVVKRPKKQ